MRTIVGLALLALYASAQAPPTARLAIENFAELTITGRVDGTGQTDGLLARITSLREEPGGRQRFFLNDLNGPLYILDKRSKAFTTYLDFNGRDARKGLFKKLSFEVGWANGLNSFQFDPDYARNGRFYTVHTEDPAAEAPSRPDNTSVAGLNVSGYTTTTAIATPGPVVRESVLIEWTDTNIHNNTFEGSARELLRVQLNTRVHPMGDLTFNPRARRGDADWRVLYIGVGDGGSGEAAQPDVRLNPQRLDTLVGKILRIIPSLDDHQAISSISDHGRYRIPNDNPFVSLEGARKEIWALGFRNPHRLHWAIDPADSRNNRLIANSIGMRTWETVNIVQRGANYGYSVREGNEAMKLDNLTEPRPVPDLIPVLVNGKPIGEVVPRYPVAQYPHKDGGGDAIGSGYLYRGNNIPALRGKYVFSDISTGRLWYADYRDLLKADDGNPDTMAPMHEIHVRWNGQVYPTMYPIVQAAYRRRGGKDPDLPGRATMSGAGRADVHVAVDADGELYIFSKSDGMIRYCFGVGTSIVP